MKGRVAGLHGCGLKGDGYGLKGDSYGLKGFSSCFLVLQFLHDHNVLIDVPNYDIFF